MARGVRWSGVRGTGGELALVRRLIRLGKRVSDFGLLMYWPWGVDLVVWFLGQDLSCEIGLRLKVW